MTEVTGDDLTRPTAAYEWNDGVAGLPDADSAGGVRRTHRPDGRADRVHRGRRAQHGHADVDQQLVRTVLQVLKGHIGDGEWADLKARMPTSLSAVLR